MSKFPIAICVLLSAVTLFPACGGSSSSGATPPPAPVTFPTVDVIVASRNGGIAIVKDLANHGVVGADVFIDNTGPTTIDSHGNLAYENDWMAVSSRDDDNILIWGGVETLISNQAANAILTVGNNVRKVTIAGGDLYAATDPGEVWIWRDITTVTTGDAPDAVLTGMDRPTMPLVHNDVLYVADRDDDVIWVYSGASTLVGGEAPTLTLPAGNVSRHLRVSNGTLWAGGDNEPGALAGWSNLPGLVDGQQPDRFVFGLFKASSRGAFAVSGNRAYIGNNNDRDGFMLFRFDLSNTALPAASVKFEESGLDRIYALDNSVDGIVVGSDNDVNAIFYYPPLFGSGTAPTGWVFDTRMQDAKDIIVIER